ELLCTARTRSGEEALARWLCAPASRTEILSRQQAVEELRNNVDLREDLTVFGPDIRAAMQPQLIEQWGSAPSTLQSTAARVVAPILAAFTVGTLLYWQFGGGPPGIFMIAAMIQVAFSQVYRRQVRDVIDNVSEPARELSVLGIALARLEREKFSSQK